MQISLLVASLSTIVSAAQYGQLLHPRQFMNVSTSSMAQVSPQTTFGAAAAAIQSARVVGEELEASSTLSSTTLAAMSSSQTSTISMVAAISTTATAQQPISTTPIVAQTTAMTAVTGASIGSQGTTTVNGNVYSTVVVASYVTVAAQPTTFYENGIAYVASCAGETITVTDCPCTLSAQIIFSTTTMCSACDGASATATAPSVATASGEAVVFTGSASTSRGAGLQTLMVGGIIIVVAGLFM